MFDKILTFFFGSQNERDVKALQPLLAQVEAKESWAQAFADEDFPRQTQLLKDRLAQGETLDDILPEAFALAREAAYRVLGERAYPVQIMGSLVLHSGRITEMKTGEGKTLMCTCAVYLNSLSGKGVHVVTVNDYLAKRDTEWMGMLFELHGLNVD
ncbi:MAG: preprotein translocase subunit SecA, partial [Treponema sp.]|nr:preprotein translocase subunit SecA [Treponema sp.]